MKQMNEISQTYTNNNDSWTLDGKTLEIGHFLFEPIVCLELIFALENLDEIKFRLLSNAEQIQQSNGFNLDWLKKNTI